jgi:hypothetical protein
MLVASKVKSLKTRQPANPIVGYQENEERAKYEGISLNATENKGAVFHGFFQTLNVAQK